MADEPTTLRLKLGKYEVRREVGRGGMGVVYEGYDPMIHRRVALKTLVSELFAGPEAETYLTRLQREAQAAGRLNHPNIVAVYDFGEEQTTDASGSGTRTAYIAMEFVEGRELKSYLNADERFTLPVIARIMRQLLDALEYSHQHGVVHRDIKPANVILLPDGSVKVADFGIARIESSTLTQAGTIMGSPSYMSPEQFLGQTVDSRSDLYSAGVVLYELLTGEVPFSGSFSNIMHRVLNDQPSPPSVLNVHVPKSVDALMARALAKRPADRFQTATEFQQAIICELAGNAGAAGEAVRSAATASPAGAPAVTSARGLGSRTTLTGAIQRSPKVAMIVAAAVLFLAAGLMFSLLRSHPSSGEAGSAVAAGATAAPGGRPVSSETPSASAQGPAAAPGAGTVASSGVSPELEQSQPVTKSGTAIITAIGLADPKDPRNAQAPAPIEHQVWGDARRQLVEKAVALYIDPRSINANYALLRDKLFSRSDAYIASILEQTPPQLSSYGLMLGTMRARVKVRDVQKSLNELAREERVDFIRNNGNPSIAVNISVRSDADDQATQDPRSAVAENILMDRIRSFGFVAVEESQASPPPDFLLRGEARLKHLTAKLAASGLTIEKVVLTSWTIRTIDARTGEEIYLNTKIPKQQSWASEELALQDVGRLIGSEFSRDFFLQYFDFGTKRVRLRFKGLPAKAAPAVLAEANAAMRILNATPRAPEGSEVILDVDLSGGADSAADLVQGALLDPLNRKLGKPCFTSHGNNGSELHVDYDQTCATDPILSRLDGLPPEALIDAPKSRIEDIVSDPARLRGTTL